MPVVLLGSGIGDLGPGGSGTHIHVLLPREERLAGRMQKQHPLNQIQRPQYQQVVRPVAVPPPHKPIQRRD